MESRHAALASISPSNPFAPRFNKNILCGGKGDVNATRPPLRIKGGLRSVAEEWPHRPPLMFLSRSAPSLRPSLTSPRLAFTITHEDWKDPPRRHSAAHAVPAEWASPQMTRSLGKWTPDPKFGGSNLLRHAKHIIDPVPLTVLPAGVILRMSMGIYLPEGGRSDDHQSDFFR